MPRTRVPVGMGPTLIGRGHIEPRPVSRTLRRSNAFGLIGSPRSAAQVKIFAELFYLQTGQRQSAI